MSTPAEREGGAAVRVADVMTTPVVAVRDITPLVEAAQLLAAHGFTALPVLDRAGRLVGVVSEADIIRASYAPGTLSGSASAGAGAAGPGGGTVQAIMRRAVLTVTGELDITDAVEIMLRARVRSVPVCRGDRLVGILTRRDLVRALTGPARRDTDIRQWLVALAGLPADPPVQEPPRRH